MAIRRTLALARCQPHADHRLYMLLATLVLGLGAWFHTGSAQAAAGATVGKLDVSLMGAANYRIPIEIPPGTAGVQPSLSLSYDSSAKNGIVGFGLTVGGLSYMTRCPGTLAQDGFVDPIDYDANDRFCLDGEKLVAVSGTYGANNTEYRLELDKFSKIVSFGTAGSGPQYFRVWTKSGEILEYGNTTDSRKLHPTNGSVVLWAMNKVSDRLNNYFTATYVNDTGTNEFRPSRIDYTGNGGVSPYNSVRFNYRTRTDPHIMFIGGVTLNMPMALDNIEVYAGSTLSRKYTLGYSGSTSSGFRISKVTECGTNNDCLPPTNFTYQGPNFTSPAQPDIIGKKFDSTTGISGTAMDDYQVQAQGDFNGDGLADLLLMKVDAYGRTNLAAPAIQLWPGQRDGKFGRIVVNTTGLASTAMGDYRIEAKGDFNGDGRTDLYVMPADSDGRSTGNANDRVWLSNGAGGFTAVSLSGTGISGTAMDDYDVRGVGDMNGDGLTDLYLHKADGDGRGVGSGADQVWLANGNLSGTFTRVIQAQAMPSGYHVQAQGDLNGDGLLDVYALAVDGGLNTISGSGSRTLLAQGNGSFSYVAAGFSYVNYQVQGQGDFNGDGLLDLYMLSTDESGRSNGDGQVNQPDITLLSKGDGFFYGVSLSLSGVQGNNFNGYRITGQGDFDGDGLTDLHMALVAADGRLVNNANDYLFVAKGDGTFTNKALSAGGEGVGSIEGAAFNFDQYLIAGNADFDGDGLTDLYFYQADGDGRSTGNPVDGVFRGLGPIPHLITKIVDGLGAELNITYAPLTDTAVYTKGSGAVYPQLDTALPLQVVKEIKSSNSFSGLSSTTYTYEAARLDLKGRGFLDFGKRTITDASAGIKVIHTQRQDFPYLGLIGKTESRRTSDNLLLEETTNTYQSLGTAATGRHPYLQQSVKKAYDLTGGALLSTVTTTNTVDAYANPTQIDLSMVDGSGTYTKSTTNSYTNTPSNWILARLTDSTVTHGHSRIGGSPTVVRKTSFTYNSTNGILTSEVLKEGGGTAFKTTSYTHDAYGNRKSAVVSGGDFTSRTTSTNYDARGQFPLDMTNAEGHKDTYLYNLSFGKPSRRTDANGLITNWGYDNLGRPGSEIRPDGTSTSTSYTACGTCPDTRAKLKVTVTETGKPTRAMYLDRLNREVIREVTGFGGTAIYVRTEYDALGRVSRVSRPYFSGSPSYTSYTYDLLGRVTQENSPVTGITNISYSGFTTTRTNAKSQVTKETKNVMDWTLSVTDAANKVVSYDYDGIGNLVRITDPAGNLTAHSYNARGQKIQTQDPDLGTWNYTYDGLDRLLSQTNAKGQTVTTSYDKLDRPLTRTEPEGSSTWTYDAGTNNKGRLTSESSPGYARSYTYDAQGRLSSSTRTLSGVGYTESQTYDTSSRVDIITYPSGFKLKHGYNSYGYLATLDDVTGTAVRLWTGNARNADQNWTQETFGNGVVNNRAYTAQTGRIATIQAGTSNGIQNLSYTFDALGNLTQRKDVRQNVTENFAYDTRNRLTSTTLGASTTSYTYDDLGNVLSKTGVGTYSYGPKPHAVSSITGQGSFSYDSNGNLLTGNGKNLTWASYDLPLSISGGGNTSGFKYGIDRARFEQTISGTGARTITYAGNRYEKHVANGITEHRNYVRAGELTVAIRSTFSSGSPQTQYLHRDHLNSIDTISIAASASERLSYDPHGQRRLPTWQPGTVTPTQARGFTGHEHLDGVNLIHMNGRIYDPKIGRFLSADPTTQFPKNLQNLNRYSYVLNNPLSFTDPSGFELSSLEPFNSASLEFSYSLASFVGYSFANLGGTYNPASATTGVANFTMPSLFGSGDFALYEDYGALNPQTGGTLYPQGLSFITQPMAMALEGADYPAIGVEATRFAIESGGAQTDGAMSGRKSGNGAVFGYSEAGVFSWRSTNDRTFKTAVDRYNARHGLQLGDAGYQTFDRLKAQAMIESGGDEDAFLSDPLQVNNSGDWVPNKASLLGLSQGQVMTPALSANAALTWQRYKGFVHDINGSEVIYRGDLEALRRYNGNAAIYNWHPGVEHRDWYATEILFLESIKTLERIP